MCLNLQRPLRLTLSSILFGVLLCIMWIPTQSAPSQQNTPDVEPRIWLPLAFSGDSTTHRADLPELRGSATVAASVESHQANELVQISLEFDGVERSAFLVLPDAYEAGDQLPLVLNLHGAGSNAIEQQAYTGFDAVANANDLLVLYPNGVNATWAALGVNENGVDDVGFLAALVEYVDAEFGLDRQRIYAFGFSQGGFMSFRLGCERADLFAAVGSVAGLMYSGMFRDCAPIRPVPIMLIHGTADQVVPYNGTALFAGANRVLASWTRYNGCPPPPSAQRLPDVVTTDDSTVVQVAASNCQAESEVLFFRINNGGHTWPGAVSNIPSLGATNRDIDANSEFASFFLRHRLP